MRVAQLKKLKLQQVCKNIRSEVWHVLFTLLFLTLVYIVYVTTSEGSLPTERQTLLDQIRLHHLTPPTERNVPYNLNYSLGSYHDHDQYHLTILEILEKHGIKKKGFFVEAGALDGEYLSHTLDLEILFGWKGLLVEASPSLVPQLRSKKRKAWIADVCLTAVDDVQVQFLTKTKQDQAWMRGNGRINPEETAINASQPKFEMQLHKSEGIVQGFKLASLLEAIGAKNVDLLVLDLEGYEFKVLETHPFNVFPIKVIAMEIAGLSIGFEVLDKFMSDKGYKLEYRTSSDAIFVLK